MEKNERRYKRFTIGSMKIKGRLIFSKIVDIVDISLGGISLKADRRLNIGGEYILKIEEKGLHISVKATVIWASLHESVKSANGDLVPIYAVGMKFNESENEKISKLIEFIAPDMHMDRVLGEVPIANEPRFHVRFQVGDSGKAVLTCPGNYSIRTVSMSGMLIETGNVLRVEEKISLEISLPGDNTINSHGRVVSCTPTKDSPEHYAIGIEFLNMPPDNSSLLARFIGMLS
jgi:Tfp pilus assembly protein PilZ